MKKFHFILIPLLLTLIPIKGNTAFENVPLTLKIHFLEFQVMTYAPITKKNIEKSADYKISIYGKKSLVSKFRNIMMKNESDIKFQESFIRLKLTMYDGKKQEEFLVDQHGGVVHSKTNKTFKLSEDQMKAITRMIMDYKGIVDMQPTYNASGED